MKDQKPNNSYFASFDDYQEDQSLLLYLPMLNRSRLNTVTTAVVNDMRPQLRKLDQEEEEFQEDLLPKEEEIGEMEGSGVGREENRGRGIGYGMDIWREGQRELSGDVERMQTKTGLMAEEEKVQTLQNENQAIISSIPNYQETKEDRQTLALISQAIEPSLDPHAMSSAIVSFLGQSLLSAPILQQNQNVVQNSNETSAPIPAPITSITQPPQISPPNATNEAASLLSPHISLFLPQNNSSTQSFIRKVSATIYTEISFKQKQKLLSIILIENLSQPQQPLPKLLTQSLESLHPQLSVYWGRISSKNMSQYLKGLLCDPLAMYMHIKLTDQLYFDTITHHDCLVTVTDSQWSSVDGRGSGVGLGGSVKEEIGVKQDGDKKIPTTATYHYDEQERSVATNIFQQQDIHQYMLNFYVNQALPDNRVQKRQCGIKMYKMELNSVVIEGLKTRKWENDDENGNKNENENEDCKETVTKISNFFGFILEWQDQKQEEEKMEEEKWRERKKVRRLTQQQEQRQYIARKLRPAFDLSQQIKNQIKKSWHKVEINVNNQQNNQARSQQQQQEQLPQKVKLIQYNPSRAYHREHVSKNSYYDEDTYEETKKSKYVQSKQKDRQDNLKLVKFQDWHDRAISMKKQAKLRKKNRKIFRGWGRNCQIIVINDDDAYQRQKMSLRRLRPSSKQSKSMKIVITPTPMSSSECVQYQSSYPYKQSSSVSPQPIILSKPPIQKLEIQSDSYIDLAKQISEINTKWSYIIIRYESITGVIGRCMLVMVCVEQILLGKPSSTYAYLIEPQSRTQKKQIVIRSITQCTQSPISPDSEIKYMAEALKNNPNLHNLQQIEYHHSHMLSTYSKNYDLLIEVCNRWLPRLEKIVICFPPGRRYCTKYTDCRHWSWYLRKDIEVELLANFRPTRKW